MLVTKYRGREGWTHRDLLRLCHLKPTEPRLAYILRYIVKGFEEADKYYREDGKADYNDPRMQEIITYLKAVEDVKKLEAPPKPKPEKMEVDQGHRLGVRKEEEMENGDDLGAGEGRKVVAMDTLTPEEQEAKLKKCQENVRQCIQLIQKFDLLREHLPTGQRLIHYICCLSVCTCTSCDYNFTYKKACVGYTIYTFFLCTNNEGVQMCLWCMQEC
jgi:hypothetical protein